MMGEQTGMNAEAQRRQSGTEKNERDGRKKTTENTEITEKSNFET